MEWYYAIDRQQKGPVSEMWLRELRESGQIQDETLIWRDGMSGWQTFGSVMPAASEPVPAGPAPYPQAAQLSGTALVPSPGSRQAGPGEAGEHNPYATARSSLASEPNRMTWTGTAWVDVPEKPNVRVMSCLERAFQDVFNGDRIFLFAGMTLIWGLCAIGLFFLFGFMWAYVPLHAGATWYFLQHIRGRRPELSDLFEGFRRNFGQLVILNLIYAGLFLLLLGIGFAVGVAGVLMGLDPNQIQLMSNAFQLLSYIPQYYLMVVTLFAIPLCIDRNYSSTGALAVSFRTASRKFWPLLGLFILANIIGTIGIFFCLIGLLVTYPIQMLALTYAYNDVFGEPREYGNS